jgi:stage II sporulation protein D
MRIFFNLAIASFALSPLFATEISPSLDQNYKALEEIARKEEVEIKILIVDHKEGALIDVQGGFVILNPETNKPIVTSSKSKRNFLQISEATIKWGSDGFPGLTHIRIVPKNKNGAILIDGIQYKGSLDVYNMSGHLQFVNCLDVEHLLTCLLSNHFPATNYHRTTYEALAITVRTHLYHTILKATNPFFHAKGDDIGYFGLGAARINPAVDKAVLHTKHLILVYKDFPFPTAWTENSAGKTASYEEIFRKKSDGPGGVCVTYAQKEREKHSWKCILTKREIAKAYNLSHLKSVELFQESSAKKIYALRLSDGEQVIDTTFFTFQRTFGKDRILSNDFTIHVGQDAITLQGYGQGPGVGICLFSADAMARIGSATHQILSEFFPATHLVKLDVLPVAE